MPGIFEQGFQYTPLERVTGGVPMIPTNHALIHAGVGYSAFRRIASLSNGSNLDSALVIPAGAYVHFQVAELGGDGAAELNIYKAADLTPGAAIMAPAQRNHHSSNTSVLTFNQVSAVNDPGDLFEGLGLFSGQQKASAGTTGDDNEWVFGSDQTYLFRVTSRATSFNGILKLFWYEEGGA